MEPFENEGLQREQLGENSAPEAQVPQEETGFYHGVGAGQKETPFVSSPYATYRPYEPEQPVYQQTQPEQKPAKEKKHYGKKVFRGFVAFLIAVALVVASSGVTALFSGLYWKQQFEVLNQYLDEKVAALEDQIQEAGKQPGIGGGDLQQPGETMTAGQIYQRNVHSVVAITATLGTSGAAAGTGFIWSENGYIITNHHVIEGATAISVTLHSGQTAQAKLIGSDATNDVALLKIEMKGLIPVTLGSSADLKVGDQVVAIGNALGELSSSLTVGYVSGMDRDVTTDGTILNMIQTDAAINSGNSGGPLFNARGEVIGITTAKYSGTTQSGASIEGISFAIPVDDVIGLLEDLRDYGYIKSPFLGVTVSNVDPQIANHYGFPVGAYVASVTPGYCAAKAGLQPKDIITELGGYKVGSLSDLSRALRKFEAGDTITLKIWRSGQVMLLQITLDEKPKA